MQTTQTARIVSVPFDENSLIFWLDGRNDCVVFDPGLQPGAIAEELDKNKLTPAAILCTHGHSDHIAGNAGMKERWPDCPLVIGQGDEYKLSDPTANLSANYGFSLTSPPADRTVTGGDTYEVAGMSWKVLDTPGHSEGHVSFLLSVEGEETSGHLVAGDVLFRRGIGRTDFPDGNFETLLRSIHDELFILPHDTIVYPGHGENTTIGEERRENPFVGAPAGYSELA